MNKMCGITAKVNAPNQVFCCDSGCSHTPSEDGGASNEYPPVNIVIPSFVGLRGDAPSCS